MLDYFIVLFFPTLAFCVCCFLALMSGEFCCPSNNNAEVRNEGLHQSGTPGVLYINQDAPESRFTPWYPTEELEVESPSPMLLSENAQPE